MREGEQGIQRKTRVTRTYMELGWFSVLQTHPDFLQSNGKPLELLVRDSSKDQNTEMILEVKIDEACSLLVPVRAQFLRSLVRHLTIPSLFGGMLRLLIQRVRTEWPAAITVQVSTD